MSEKPQDEQLCPECAQPCTRDSQGDVQRHERGGGMGCAFGWENQPQAPARRHEGECADERRGLYGKYIIQRADGSDASGGKHAGCQYFVLDLTHDNYALPALREYARWCRGQFPLLADDLDALRTGNKAFDLTAQAPAPSLDARDLTSEEIADVRRHGVKVLGHPDVLTALLDEVERRRAAPSAPSDALRAAFASALKTLSKWKAAWSERDRHTAIRMRVEASEETRDLMELDPAALAASPSVTPDAINEAWIKGCLAGRGEGARVARRHGDGLSGSELAEAILELPAPTAPKGPQR